MRISWSWLSEFVDLSPLKGPAELAELLTQRGLEVEGIDRQDQGFEKVITAQILERKPHPQADRLSLCQVTLGSGDPLEIVCGAQNMKAGDKIALAQIGALLPNGLKIESSKIRGVLSAGMLCSEEELKLKEKSEGILILPPETPVGRPLAEILGRDDCILTLKLTANRGDCMSHYGIAREVAAALNQEVKKPKVLPMATALSLEKSPISVHLEAGELAPQFFGCAIEGVKVGPSPAWVVKRLESIGQRSINTVVDATNLVLHELGHPMHAYDADRIEGKSIQVRLARAGETLPLLDGATITLEGSEIVIANGRQAIGLAGVMGGGNSEVQAQTCNLFLEAAEFDPIRVRKSSSRHQRRTEAAMRFEKGIDPKGVSFAMSRLATLILELAGGKVVGGVSLQLPSRGPLSPLWKRQIQFHRHYLNDFLGFKREDSLLTEEKIQEVLTQLSCHAKREGEEWVVTPPSYRWDLNRKEDLAEEVARSVGYDQIPSTLPVLTSSPISKISSHPLEKLKDRAKAACVQSGLRETINLAFTSRTWLEKFGLPTSTKILNPLSEEHECLVPSLLPGLIRNALDNGSHHFGSEPLAIRLFELRPTFSALGEIQSKGEMETGVEEKWKLSFVVSGPRFQSGLRNEMGEVDFYDLKSMIDILLTSLGTKGTRYQPLSASRVSAGGRALHALFHPGQSAEILAGSGVAGTFGLLHPAFAKEFKTRAPLWLAELNWDVLTQFSRQADEVPGFKNWPAFPSMERDFALLVKNEVTFDKLCQVALKSGKPIAKIAKVFDIYKGSQVAQGMTSVAVRVIFYHETRSLQEAETEQASAQILQGWKKELGVELR